MKKITIALLAGLLACTLAPMQAAQANYRTIPLPAKITDGKGAFALTPQTTIVCPHADEQMTTNGRLLAEYLHTLTGVRPAVVTGKKGGTNTIVLETGLQAANSEAYTLTVSPRTIKIKGSSPAAVFRGIQTLRKATPATAPNTPVHYPAVNIADEPRFGYRGLHLDVARHFQPVDVVKRYIDLIALHGMNHFHWHLTDDQGWRIEIKAYPELTKKGAYRPETVVGRNSGTFDATPHGGFYTHDEIRDVVRYAAERHITVIPEIDLPGHMLAALAAYPELGCTGGPYRVGQTWGVFDDVLCVGRESTFAFLQAVLDEVVELFPAKYIHIGGDECPKVRWEACPHCQAKIRELGLTDDSKHKKEFYLQSYVTARIEEYLAAKGRRIIGWDEILEGTLAPNATVMSWRGMDGGLQAVKMGHDVIMTPTSHVYFDYYQTDNRQNEPLAIGGYAPVATVYDFDPMPAQLTPDEQKHILGAQANIWTEYIKKPDHLEYMLLPRLAALSEALWNMPERKNYIDFLRRLPLLIAQYQHHGYHYAKHVFEVQAKATPDHAARALRIDMATIDDAPIHYTLDGTTPNAQSPRYLQPLMIKQSAEVRAVAIRPGGETTPVYAESFRVSQSTFKPIQLLTRPAGSYTYTGKTLLNDGLRGKDANFRTGRWMGFDNTDLVAVIDLQQPTSISKVAVQTCVDTGEWILDARDMRVEVSDDGINYQFVAGLETDPDTRQEHWRAVMNHTVTFPTTTARYVKVTVGTFPTFPAWHGAPAGKAFVFVDEIAIN